MLDSRWNFKRQNSEDGLPVRDKPTKAHYSYLEMLCPGLNRHPWTYQYLSPRMIAALNGRTLNTARTHLKFLRKTPHYIVPADQGKSNSHSIINHIGPAGIRVLEEHYERSFPRFRGRSVPHELMACLIAASFELSRFEIEIHNIVLADVEPDWQPFSIKNQYHHLLILIEADTGINSEPVSSGDPERSSIIHKFRKYLPLIHSGALQDTMICIVTTGNIRRQSMLKWLPRIIDELKYPKRYASQFIFKAIKFDKHFDELPPATPWAGTEDWLRAGYEPFNFTKPEIR